MDSPKPMTKRIEHKFNLENIENSQELEKWVSSLRLLPESVTPEIKIEKKDNEHVVTRSFIKGEILKSSSLEFHKAIELIYSMLNSLGEFHKSGIPHMNIKPENILLCDGNTVFLDPMPEFYYEILGIDDKDLKQKLKYGPPEAAIGFNPGLKGDIYRLGVIFYIVLTGKNPFLHYDPVMEGRHHLSKELIPPHVINEEIPLYLSRIILTMTAKDPAERFIDSLDVIGAMIKKDVLPLPSSSQFLEIPDDKEIKKIVNLRRVLIVLIILTIFSLLLIFSEQIKWNIYIF